MKFEEPEHFRSNDASTFSAYYLKGIKDCGIKECGIKECEFCSNSHSLIPLGTFKCGEFAFFNSAFFNF